MGFAGFGLLTAFFYAVVTGDGGGADYLGFIDAEVWVGAASLGWSGGVGDHVGYLRFSFATNTETIIKGIKRIKNSLEKLR